MDELDAIRNAFIDISKQLPDEFDVEERDNRRPDENGLILRYMEKGAPMCIYFSGTGTLVSENLVQAYCSGRGISMVFASTLGRTLYKRTTMEALSAQLDQMVKTFNALIDEYKPSSVTVVAGSRYSILAGGIAARINADKILVASPVTQLRESSANVDRGDSVGGIALMEHMRHMLPEDHQDLLVMLKDWSQTNHMHIVYSTWKNSDVFHSIRMKKLNNMHMYPQPTWPSHDSMPLVLASGLLLEVIKGS